MTANYTFFSRVEGQLEVHLSYDGERGNRRRILWSNTDEEEEEEEEEDGNASSSSSYGSGSSRTKSERMLLRGGEAHYFEMVHSSNGGGSFSQLVLNVHDEVEGLHFNTSLIRGRDGQGHGYGLSGEWFREIVTAGNATSLGSPEDYQFEGIADLRSVSTSDYVYSERMVTQVEVRSNSLLHACYRGSSSSSSSSSEEDGNNATNSSNVQGTDGCTFRYAWESTPIITGVR